ncbi:MAG: 2-hydroxyacyl-CoA dehydratase family protein [Dehalococcoidia bacterium]|jgi:benzoyl-CoA reductase/2-hydroxyglutaryl-CoA dehydratase subunit BcrC/BadD/HgdB
MKEFLELCGFTSDEIAAELPRVEKAFEIAGLTGDDIETARQRLTGYYDMELKGVRKAFRLCILEMVNTILAREEGKKKIIFGFMIPGFETIGQVLMSKSSDVYTSHLSWSFLIVMGCIFGKFEPVLEAAEKKWLKAGIVAHCANVKTLLGLVALDIIPRPDLMLTSGFMCETAPKTLDLLHELYEMPIYSLDTCLDRGAADLSETIDRSSDLLKQSLRKLVERIEEIVGFRITDDMLWEGLEARSRFDRTIGKLQRLIHYSDPLPLSPTHDNIWMILSSLTYNSETISDAIDTADTLYEEIQERVNNGFEAVPKGSPKVLGEMFAHHADPRLEHLAGELGIALVVATAASTIRADSQLKDPYEAMSLAWGGSRSSGFIQKIPEEIELYRKMHIDGLLERYHVGCRTVVGDAIVIQNAVQKELGIPVLLLEWENFDPRVYKHEEYKRRLEIFKSMMVNKKS